MIFAKRKTKHLAVADFNILQEYLFPKGNPNGKRIKQILFFLFFASVFFLQNPTSVYADELNRPTNGDLQVGGVSVNTSEGATTEISGTNWSYDYATNTLILTGDISEKNYIYTIWAKTGDLNILVKENVTLFSNSYVIQITNGNLNLTVEQGKTLTFNGYKGIEVKVGDCNLFGEGSVFIKNSNVVNEDTFAIWTNGNINISDITFYGESSLSTIFAEKNITIDNATIIAKSSSCGISVNGELTVQNNSTVYVESSNRGIETKGLFVTGDTTIVAGYALGEASDGYVPNIIDPVAKIGIWTNGEVSIQDGHLIVAGTENGFYVGQTNDLSYGNGKIITDSTKKTEYVGNTHINSVYKSNGDNTHSQFCLHDNALKTIVEIANCSSTTNANCISTTLCDTCHTPYTNANNHVKNSYSNGFRDCCGIYEVAVDFNEDGFYEINNAGNLFWFAEQVNSGMTNINAIVTSDIDINYKDWIPIGSETYSYIGSFDGQHFCIKNMTINTTNSYQGLFGVVGGGATISNITIDSSCSIIQAGNYSAGLVGGSNGSGMVTIIGCGNEADVNAGKNAAGIFGVNMDSKAEVIIKNCYNTGDIITFVDGAGAISGWIGNVDTCSVSYCWNIGTVNGTDSDSFARGTNISIIESYNLNTLPTSSQTSVKFVVMEHIINGALTYYLNTAQNTYAWYQNLDNGETPDTYPILKSSHGVVYWGYANCGENASYSNQTRYDSPLEHSFESIRCQVCNEEAIVMDANGKGYMSLKEALKTGKAILLKDYEDMTNIILSGDAVLDLNSYMFSGYLTMAAKKSLTITNGTMNGKISTAMVFGKLIIDNNVTCTTSMKIESGTYSNIIVTENITLPEGYCLTDSSGNQITEIAKNETVYVRTIVSVDITWSAMEFTYVEGAWNPSTYTYGEGAWQPTEDGGKILIENKGNTDVNITVVFTPQIENLYGVFDISELDISYLSVKNQISDMELKKEKTATILLELFEKPTQELKEATIGTITITITK